VGDLVFRGAATAVLLMLIAGSHFIAYAASATVRGAPGRARGGTHANCQGASTIPCSRISGCSYRCRRCVIESRSIPLGSSQRGCGSEKGDQTIIQAREAVQDFRASGIEAGDLEAALTALREELAQPDQREPAHLPVVGRR